MFVRLLVYAGWLALYCFGLMGCGEEDPVSSVEIVDENVVVSDVATLVETGPANGGDAAYDRPVRLYFDKTPLAVSVNGTPAKVKGNLVCWYYPSGWVDSDLFHIEWTNPDGTKNAGIHIRLRVADVSWAELEIASGPISDGAADVDPDALNHSFIRYDFTEPAVVLKAKLLTKDGVDLGWEAVWRDQTLEIFPTAEGQFLEHGKRYMIHIVLDEAWVYSSDACECMDCSWFRNHEWIIRFATIEA